MLNDSEPNDTLFNGVKFGDEEEKTKFHALIQQMSIIDCHANNTDNNPTREKKKRDRNRINKKQRTIRTKDFKMHCCEILHQRKKTAH